MKTINLFSLICFSSSCLRGAFRDAAISLCCILLTTTCVFAQTKPLQIGDRLPDLVIKGLINQPSNQVNTKDLKNSPLLIINFWATWCKPCIKEIKYLDSLKAKHPGKFNVLSVTYENTGSILKFLGEERNKDIHTSNLLIATGEKTLHELFPHKFIPHNIWVDSTGTIKAITASSELTENNILGFQSGSKSDSLKVKMDNLQFDPWKPFRLGDSIYTYRSIITPHIEGINGGMFNNSKRGQTSRYFQWNGAIIQFFWAAYSGFAGGIRYNLIEVHTNDSLRFYYPIREYQHLIKSSKYKDWRHWRDHNTFVYELSLPKAVSDTIFRNYMFNDLERQFNVRAGVEPRMTPCIVASRKNSNFIQPEQGDPNLPTEIRYSKTQLIVKNARIDDLLSFLFKRTSPELLRDPIVNQVKGMENYYFNLVLDFSEELKEKGSGITLDLVFKKLGRYGLVFERRKILHPILVLYDQNK